VVSKWSSEDGVRFLDVREEPNLISSRGQPTKGGPPGWGLGEGLTTSPFKTALFSNINMQDASSGDKTIRR